MSTKFLVKRKLKGLFPVESVGEEFIDGLSKEDLIWVEVSKPRNAGHHRKFFAMLKVIREATDYWPSEEVQLIHLKLAIGHVDFTTLPDGQTIVLPKSISFAKMDQTQFETFYDKALAQLCELAGGIDSADVRQAVLEELSGG